MEQARSNNQINVESRSRPFLGLCLPKLHTCMLINGGWVWGILGVNGMYVVSREVMGG